MDTQRHTNQQKQTTTDRDRNIPDNGHTKTPQADKQRQTRKDAYNAWTNKDTTKTNEDRQGQEQTKNGQTPAYNNTNTHMQARTETDEQWTNNDINKLHTKTNRDRHRQHMDTQRHTHKSNTCTPWQAQTKHEQTTHKTQTNKYKQ